MENKKYIIKKLSPWMMDELIAFSNGTRFDIILLRQQDSFYNDDLQKLKDNNIRVFIKPQSLGHFFKKLWISVIFVFKNIERFRLNYNSVLGLKSIIWFLRLDLSKFSTESNIHAQFATQAAILSILIKQYYQDKPTVSFTFHAHDIYFDNKWFKLLVEKSAKCFSISEFNIEYVSKKYEDSGKLELARLGVFITDDIKNHIIPQTNSDIRFVFGLLSRFVEKKGIKYLLDSMKQFKDQGKTHIKLIFAGDGPLKEEILNFVKENNLENQIEYIGTVKDESKMDFFKSLDAFVLPSIKLENDMDGIPVVLMEAIAFGLPVISTDVSGIPEICINDYNGYLIEERNVEALVTAMSQMDSNEVNRKKFSKNSLILSDQYNIQKNSDKKMKILNWI